MESLTPVSRYTSQSSKKRVFPGGSSSSGCENAEVLEAPPPPPINTKNKEKVIFHEMIDMNTAEDYEDVIFVDEKVDSSGKGKEVLSSYSTDGSVSLSDVEMSDDGIVDDPDSSIFNGEEEWIDKYYDDILYDEDDDKIMESHFDHMDIPPGVEAPVPWFPVHPQENSNFPTTNTLTGSNPQLNPTAIWPTSSSQEYPNSLHSADFFLPKPIKEATKSLVKGKTRSSSASIGYSSSKNQSTSSSSNLSSFYGHKSGFQYPNVPPYSHGMGSLPSVNINKSGHYQSSNLPSNVHGMGDFPSVYSNKGGHEYSNLTSNSHAIGNFPSVHGNKSGHQYAVVPSNSHGLVDFSSVHGSKGAFQYMPPNLHGMGTPSSDHSSKSGFTFSDVPPGMGTSLSAFEEWEKDTTGTSFPGFTAEYPFSPSAPHAAYVHKDGSPFVVDKEKLDEILQKFERFEKFDTVEDYSDHYYGRYGYSGKQAPKGWAKSVQDEWKILEKNLPDMIFVRVYESRMDLLRAVIIGAEGTPYHDGLFFFDIFFPANYPDVPPLVHYHAGGLRINPNLYDCGKVCLSLLNTWPGQAPKETWVRGVSTILQVLVSIQGLILNTEPFYNEPGYEGLSGTPNGQKKSSEYNEQTFMHSLQTMVYTMRRPPKYFEDFVVGHFCKHARDILLSCQAYSGGAVVGSLVKGVVQNAERGEKSSKQFKYRVTGFITTMVNTFTQIGAKDCEEFLPSSQKNNKPAAASSRAVDVGN
ncbi:hypothetical protein ABFS83_13G074500 [Erythranthe nasuta]